MTQQQQHRGRARESLMAKQARRDQERMDQMRRRAKTPANRRDVFGNINEYVEPVPGAIRGNQDELDAFVKKRERYRQLQEIGENSNDSSGIDWTLSDEMKSREV